MPIYKHTVTDGITSEMHFFISAPRSASELRKDKNAIRAIVEEHNRRCTFDGRVAELERTCQRTPGVSGEGPQAPPVFGSRAWYAREILFTMQVVRDALVRNEPQLAASEAVLIGLLAAEAEAKFRWGHLLLRQARHTKNRELSQRSADMRRAATADRDTSIMALSRAYRGRHPTHSKRSMAMSIARELDMKVGTVRDRLRKLRIR